MLTPTQFVILSKVADNITEAVDAYKIPSVNLNPSVECDSDVRSGSSSRTLAIDNRREYELER